MSRDQVVDQLRKAIRYNDKATLKLFRALESHHGGLRTEDLSSSKALALLRMVLHFALRKEEKKEKEEKEDQKEKEDTQEDSTTKKVSKPLRTLIQLLRALRRRDPPMQVDRMVRRLGTTRLMGTRRTIPYTITRTKTHTRARTAWVRGLMNDDIIRSCIDLNRPVTSERRAGNLLVASYAEVHIYDAEWYTYLLDEAHLAVNSIHRGSTLKDYVVNDIRRLQRPAKPNNTKHQQQDTNDPTPQGSNQGDAEDFLRSPTMSQSRSRSRSRSSRASSGGRPRPTLAQAQALLDLLERHGGLTVRELRN